MKRITIYETKQCGECKQDFQSSNYNKSGLCKRCVMNRHNKSNRLKREEYKKPYPLSKNEQKKRYRRIIKELSKTITKEERRAIYKRELEYMISSGIWKWCIDIRSYGKYQAKEPGKIGRKPLDKTDVKLKHPNTKDWHD